MPAITRPARVTAADSLAVAATLVLPALAQGVVVRRPSMVRLAALTRAEERAIRLLRRLRATYGDGPLLVPVPGRGRVMLPLASRDVRAVLEDRAFSPASRDKRGALAHFQPDGVLITPERDLRDRRRALNEQVLHTGRVPVTEIAALAGSGATGPGATRAAAGITEASTLARISAEEAATLPRHGTLTWPLFQAAHWRLARRVVLGDGARHDVTLTRQLDRLRRDANWAWLRGQRTDVRNAFQRRLAAHLARAEPGSLAGEPARTQAAADVHAEGQVPHWLFAYDAGAMAAYRALALLTSPMCRQDAGSQDQGSVDRGRQGGGSAGDTGVPEADRLRAAVLESVRLWPTTLAILREVTGPNPWDLPIGTTVVIHSPYVNREEPGASYRPDLWLEGGPEPGHDGGTWAGVPFSGGFARCPGEDLVLATSAALLGAFLRERTVRPSVTLENPMPVTFDHFRLRFTINAAER
ncbi:cytochrome P450 [Nonomuraea maheshkhaliensis]|uniref:Cytochrome P450 n=1 Tax=Nonomuraea maheshkhaliensis TaxID=419590 RepID=A0ABN2G4P0_9ACTN